MSKYRITLEETYDVEADDYMEAHDRALAKQRGEDVEGITRSDSNFKVKKLRKRPT